MGGGVKTSKNDVAGIYISSLEVRLQPWKSCPSWPEIIGEPLNTLPNPAVNELTNSGETAMSSRWLREGELSESESAIKSKRTSMDSRETREMWDQAKDRVNLPMSLWSHRRGWEFGCKHTTLGSLRDSCFANDSHTLQYLPKKRINMLNYVWRQKKKVSDYVSKSYSF